MWTLVFLVLALCSTGAWGLGYKVASLTPTATGFEGFLTLTGPGPYGADIANLSLQVYFQSQTTLRIKISDPNNQRWEVPFVNNLQPPTSKPAALDYSVTFTNNPFGFAITRLSNNDVIFNTTSTMFNPLIFEDQYLELSTVLPNNPNIYGLGERMTSLRLPLNTNFTIWNRDQGTPVIQNLYGTHPFYLEMRNTGLAHGAFILNGNAQEFYLAENYLTYKTIGGIFDIFVFLGPTPASVVQQYHAVIGTPHFPPYWGLGWHQCRWGYNTIQATAEVVANYSAFDIPLDTMWNDIDYMDSYRDFTNDPVRFPQSEVRQFVQGLHANGQHYIMIIDPGISIDPGYSSYDQLLTSGAYVKEFGTNNPIPGKVWPGSVYFPDFFHPNATAYWYDQIAAFHAAGPEFDGMWIDMNELSNFCFGQCDPTEESTKSVKITDQQNFGTNYENPPYVPGGTPLDTSTVNVTAQQYLSTMYNLHNMYGWSEGIASKLGLEQLRGTRSVVISRSSFAGSGHHNGHWLGDNDSSFIDLYYSIPGILTMQMFGINFVGADICGFGGDTTEELCSRWMQVGSLYPFSRNHNSIGSVSQEPYAFGPTLLNISRDSLNRRYTLLPYFYTLFASAHFNATTVWRPLFFEFPTDTNTFGIDQQFLIGAYLLASPVLVQNGTSVDAYFPQALWYSYYDGTPLVGTGQTVTLSAPLDFIPLHVRGGGIIPTQQSATTTTAARKNPYGLLVALDKNGTASGEFYLDDGELLDPIATQLYSLVSFSVSPSGSGSVLSSTVLNNKYLNSTTPPLGNVTVYGVTNPPSKVVANGAPATFAYNKTTQVLSIWNLAIQIISNFQIIWA